MAELERREKGRVVLIRQLLLAAGAILMVFPFAWMILTSLKSSPEAMSFPPTFLPERPLVSNFALAWNAAPFGRYFVNSTIQSIGTMGLVLVTSLLAAYAFAQMSFKGKQLIFVLFLATMMVPFEVVLIPNSVIIRRLGWYDSFPGLIVPHGASAFSIFLLRQAFKGLPRDLWDAARMDGATHLLYLTRVATPIILPSVVVVALFSFLGSWNALLWPLIATSSTEMRTVQVGLMAFTQDSGVDFPLLMAASAFVIAPVIVLFLIAQRYLIEGITNTGSKG